MKQDGQPVRAHPDIRFHAVDTQRDGAFKSLKGVFRDVVRVMAAMAEGNLGMQLARLERARAGRAPWAIWRR